MLSLIDVDSPHQENISTTIQLLQLRAYSLMELSAILEVSRDVVQRYINMVSHADYNIEEDESGGLRLVHQGDPVSA